MPFEPLLCARATRLWQHPDDQGIARTASSWGTRLIWSAFQGASARCDVSASGDAGEAGTRRQKDTTQARAHSHGPWLHRSAEGRRVKFNLGQRREDWITKPTTTTSCADRCLQLDENHRPCI